MADRAICSTNRVSVAYQIHTTSPCAAFLAVQKAMEHETSEQFKYKGVAPYDPHLKIGDLVALAQNNDLDGRVRGPTFD